MFNNLLSGKTKQQPNKNLPDLPHLLISGMQVLSLWMMSSYQSEVNWFAKCLEFYQLASLDRIYHWKFFSFYSQWDVKSLDSFKQGVTQLGFWKLLGEVIWDYVNVLFFVKLSFYSFIYLHQYGPIVLSFFSGLLRLHQIWPVGVPSRWFLSFLTCPYHLLISPLLYSKMPRLISLFSYSSPGCSYFSKKPCFVFIHLFLSGQWPLETKIWVQRMLVTIGVSFLLSLLVDRSGL